MTTCNQYIRDFLACQRAPIFSCFRTFPTETWSRETSFSVDATCAFATSASASMAIRGLCVSKLGSIITLLLTRRKVSEKNRNTLEIGCVPCACVTGWADPQPCSPCTFCFLLESATSCIFFAWKLQFPLCFPHLCHCPLTRQNPHVHAPRTLRGPHPGPRRPGQPNRIRRHRPMQGGCLSEVRVITCLIL